MFGRSKNARISGFFPALLLLVLVTLNAIAIIPSLIVPVHGQAQMNKGVVVGRDKDVGIQFVKRAGIGWITTAVRFDENFASVYAETTKSGISILGSLDYWTLNWRNFTLDEWTKTVRKAADIYPLIRVWDIWNEPTLEKYALSYMDGTPEHYFEMLRVAYTILKGANRENVILGLGGAQLGMPRDLIFAQAVFRLGGGDYMDGISIHAYAYNLNKGVSWESYKQVWVEYLSKYKQFNKPLWLTETGLRSDQKSEGDQVAYLQASFQFFLEQGFKAYFWYHLRDWRNSDGSMVQYGLIRLDKTPKPSYTTYRDL